MQAKTGKRKRKDSDDDSDDEKPAKFEGGLTKLQMTFDLREKAMAVYEIAHLTALRKLNVAFFDALWRKPPAGYRCAVFVNSILVITF